MVFLFLNEENEYLKNAVRKRVKISRMAIRLGREYDDVALRLVELGYISQEVNNERLNAKFATQDEVEFDMLKDGNTEEDIEKTIGSTRVFLSSNSNDSLENDDD